MQGRVTEKRRCEEKDSCRVNYTVGLTDCTRLEDRFRFFNCFALFTKILNFNRIFRNYIN